MLVMTDCAIEPGDIICLVSNSSKWLTRLKMVLQSRTTSRSKHGHREVISVFVCTGKNKYGITCHNYERRLSISDDKLISTLQEQTTEELIISLLRFFHKECTVAQIMQTLELGTAWMKQFSVQMEGCTNSDELIEALIGALEEDKEKLIQLILAFWRNSGEAEILPAVNSSLLVFKHTDSTQRKQFLEAFLEQVKLTERLKKQGKERTSFWAAIKTVLLSSKQDQNDRKSHFPAEGTLCSQNLIEVLNQVDFRLVNRGRHSLPKTLEAALREATQTKKPINEALSLQADDEFEDLIAKQEVLLPRFRLQILPAAGKKLVSSLLAVVDNEIKRIEGKKSINDADRKKISEIKQCLVPFRTLKYQEYPISLQVDIALKLIATLYPVLQKKTGVSEVWGEWVFTKSYAKLRAYARTQGIFDGDIRQAIEKLKQQRSQESEEKRQAAIIDNESCITAHNEKEDDIRERYCLGGYGDIPSLVESRQEDSIMSLQSEKKPRFFAEQSLKKIDTFLQEDRPILRAKYNQHI